MDIKEYQRSDSTLNQIRKANTSDIPFLIKLEAGSFDASRQSNPSSIKNSIDSSHQVVWILSINDVDVASAIVFLYPKSMRIYSIAVIESYRGQSLGKQLMEHIINQAIQQGCYKVTLEVDAQNLDLMHWYEFFGFRVDYDLKDYYGQNQPAFRMSLVLEKRPSYKRKKITNVVVVDTEVEWLKSIETIDMVDAQTFISNPKYQSTKGLRIFNLCSSYAYQSLGYYVSLLASARNQRVIPNVATIKDFSDASIIESIGDEVHELIQKSLASIQDHQFTLYVYFGATARKSYSKLGKALYKLFEAPLLEFCFEKSNQWNLRMASPLPLSAVPIDESITKEAHQYFSQKRFTISRFKDYKYDLAILIDPNEKTPPSCKIALSKFKWAANKIGFYVEFVTKEDYHRIGEFDALFIRTTTSVNDYTYQFSRYAYAEGLVVIDDPWSILKCSNKLFFAESMKTANVLTPKSVAISKHSDLNSIIKELPFPLVLKEPDNAFSLGVFKVSDIDTLTKTLERMFKTSELVVAQEFIKSTFDWRVGVLDNVPLFVCKYYMAKNHWQIYNWNARSNRNMTGNVDTIPIESVPKNVLSTAIQAASVMGDGLYGVDLKEVDGKVYVIEVNDNPNVDYHIEDKILDNELYLRVMRNMFSRIETARNIKRGVSKDSKPIHRKQKRL